MLRNKFLPFILLPLFLFTGFSPQLRGQILDHRQGELIVRFSENHSLQKLQKQLETRSSKNLLNALHTIRKLGTEWNTYLLGFDFTSVKASELIPALEATTHVEFVQRNHLVRPRLIPNDPLFDNQWYHVNSQNSHIDFDSDKAWDLTTGGVSDQGDTLVICIIDDGIEINHEDISDNIWINHAEIENNGIDDDLNGYTDDKFGWNTYKSNDDLDIGKHGTQVTGLAGAVGNNGKGISGICWQVKVMFVQGGGDEANAIESYQYPFLLRKIYNASGGSRGAYVVATNTSWGSDYGRPEDAPLWCAVYDSLGSVGILNIASTTNQNIDVDLEGDLPTTCESDYLLTVTNINDQDVKDPSSGYGKKSIDLGAYGEFVYSTYINNSYRVFSGTSASSPQVTGAVALLYSLSCNNLSILSKINPAQAALEAKSLLLKSSRQIDDLKNITVSGGVLNLDKALQAVRPYHIKEINSESAILEWEASALFPIYLRYRANGTLGWTDTTIYSGRIFKLDGLASCTEYEIQYKNICFRNADQYSPSYLLRTLECCDEPVNIKLIQRNSTEALVQYQAESDENLYALLRKSGSIIWDTFLYHQTSRQIQLANLDACSEYELQLYFICNNQMTPNSQSFYFQTDGCENCSNADYCRRFRPSGELEWIDAISFDSFVFRSGNNDGYGNFTGSNHRFHFEKNKTYHYSLFAGYANDTTELVTAAYIDYNQDGVFEDLENIALPTLLFKYSNSYQLSIPTNAKSGWTRMRICLKFAKFTQTAPLPCFQSIEFGEYEDYCVYISETDCNVVENLSTTFINNHNAAFTFTNTSSNAFIYTFRKLYNGQWITGFTDRNQITLHDLDSCSRYDLKLVAVCRDRQSDPVFYKFNTTGMNCTTSVSDERSSSFQLYPNPCYNQLTLLNQEQHLLQRISIYNLTGVRVLDQILNVSPEHYELKINSEAGYHFMVVQLQNGRKYCFPFIKL